MASYPDDSPQDIWNETFIKWELPYRMRPNYYIIDRIGE